MHCSRRSTKSYNSNVCLPGILLFLCLCNECLTSYIINKLFVEVLSSDEDDIDDDGQDYLETLRSQVTTAGTAAGFQLNATINDISADSDDSDSDYENEDTVLEAYGTPLDEEECDIDEYMVFKEVMQSN